MAVIETTTQMVEKVYQTTRNHLKSIDKKGPLTLAEKILFGHLDGSKNQNLERGKSFLMLRPDRVAMQDATAQMALLQFMLSGKNEVAVPSTVHCDHLILAYRGASEDMKNSRLENDEVFEFLSSASSRYGIGFWKPGAGIIHQVVLENYAFPGGLMIGTDSHTPNAGGLSMVAIGVGGADASDVMAGLPWEVKNPRLIGVHLKGKLEGWASPKDVILKLLGILSVKGGTDRIVEYFGEGTQSISATGKATITNMGAELGATCSVFPYDSRIKDYLEATNRKELAQVAEKNKDLLCADREVTGDPEKYYDQVIEIDLDKLEPHLVGPHTPDLAHSLTEIKEKAGRNNWPADLSAALIGSCTNSSYEDVGRAADVARQAMEAGIREMPQTFMVSPGSTMIQNTIERDGQMKTFNDVGATVLANACGPCIGQWRRDDFKKGDVNTIVTSFNRNFKGRNDANPDTLSFIGSPETVMALGLAGRLDFNPVTDTLETPTGPLKLQAPEAPEFPQKGFVNDSTGYQAPQGSDMQVKVASDSRRLQILTPFDPWDGEELTDMIVLAKVGGKCTTDHISPAGKWLRFRGHLDNISDNMLLTAVNDFTGEVGTGKNQITGEKNISFSKLGRYYKSKNQKWLIIGDENYGEGSSREHAAMSPRFLGARAVIVKSFSRIHETNLKKQGVLALTFSNPSDYEKIQKDDRLTIRGLKEFAPNRELHLEITRDHGTGNSSKNSSRNSGSGSGSVRNSSRDVETIILKHSYNSEQIKWFQAGSALNLLRRDNVS